MTLAAEEKAAARRWYTRARRLMQSEKYDQAVDACSRAIEADRQYGAAYFCRGACQYMLGRYKSAAADMDAAALFGCRDARFWSRYEINAKDTEGG